MDVLRHRNNASAAAALAVVDDVNDLTAAAAAVKEEELQGGAGMERLETSIDFVENSSSHATISPADDKDAVASAEIATNETPESVALIA